MSSSRRRRSDMEDVDDADDDEMLMMTRSNKEQKGQVKETPLPRKEMFVTACVFLSESFANSMLFPFVAFMVWDFEVVDSPTEVGYYAGLLASCFSFAQFISSFWWGVWSDRVGRKRVLMVGMAGSLVSVLMFGLSVNYTWALITRTIHGLLNGNLAVARSYVGDVTDGTNQARAMSITSLIYGLGVILGPTVGGFLSQPTQKYHALFPPESFHGNFLEQFPYFLPCLVSTIISATGMLGGYLLLEEKPRPKPALVVDETIVSPNPTSSANLGDDVENAVGDYSYADEQRFREEVKQELEAELQEAKEKLLQKVRQEKTTKQGSNWDQLKEMVKEIDVVVCAMLYGLLTFSVLVFVEVFSLWMITKPEVGGLGFNSNDVGIAFAVVGITVVVFQLFVYPNLEKKFGSLALFRCGITLLIFPFIAFPTLYLIVPYGTLVIWSFVIPLSIVRALGATLGYTAIFVLINNAANPETRGAANGFSEAIASIAKTIGPVAGGALFAWSLTNELSFPFNHYFIFLVLAVGAALCVLLSLKLDSSRVDGARQSAGEAKGLLEDWREKKQSDAQPTTTTRSTYNTSADEKPQSTTHAEALYLSSNQRGVEDDEAR